MVVLLLVAGLLGCSVAARWLVCVLAFVLVGFVLVGEKGVYGMRLVSYSE
jgi:hypothetical protein